MAVYIALYRKRNKKGIKKDISPQEITPAGKLRIPLKFENLCKIESFLNITKFFFFLHFVLFLFKKKTILKHLKFFFRLRNQVFWNPKNYPQLLISFLFISHSFNVVSILADAKNLKSYFEKHTESTISTISTIFNNICIIAIFISEERALISSAWIIKFAFF